VSAAGIDRLDRFEEEGVMSLTMKKRPANSTLRLELDPSPIRAATLDGTWWPHTTDALLELPPLLDVLAGMRGDITHVLLCTTAWDLPHPRRIGPDRRAARLGWYTSQPADLVTIMTEFGRDRFDLRVVAPGTAEAPPAG
jgi:hypothetical protein